MPGAESIHFKCKRCYSGCKNDASDVFHLRSNSGCNKESISCWVLSLTQGCPPWSMIWCHLSELKRKFEEEGELDSWCQLKAKLTLHMVSRRPLYTVQGIHHQNSASNVIFSFSGWPLSRKTFQLQSLTQLCRKRDLQRPSKKPFEGEAASQVCAGFLQCTLGLLRGAEDKWSLLLCSSCFCKTKNLKISTVF